jgi:hypothetical protein
MVYGEKGLVALGCASPHGLLGAFAWSYCGLRTAELLTLVN